MSRCGKVLIVAGIVFGVAILIPVIRHYQLRFAVASYIAELKAKGEPMDLEQVIPPPVPSEKNGLPFITNALANLTLKYGNVATSNPPPAMFMVAPGRAMVGWQQPDLRISGRNTWEDSGRDLAAVKSDLDSFQNLTNHPILDFNLDYQKGNELQLPHLASLKRSVQWLSASALYDLHQGNPQNACADVCAMLDIVKGETDERPTISQLVRIAIASIGASATWEILQNPDVSEDDLAQLQQDWQSLEFAAPLEQTMMFERIEHLQRFAQIRKSSEKFDELWGIFYAPNAPLKKTEDMFPSQIRRSLFLRKWDELRWRWFWSYQDELRGLKVFQGLEPNQNSLDGLRNFFPQSFNSLAATKRKAKSIETARNVVITAIALKRYELRHHQFPPTLDQLTPDLLKAVPIDSMDGEPLRYRPRADGTFLLYSVGENGVDDGGDPSLEKGVNSSSFYWQNAHALDWVWPQPATAEEIQKYYEEQAKKSK